MSTETQVDLDNPTGVQPAHSKSQQRLSATSTHWWILVAVATLPFQEALTYHWLFPIKICEIALLLAVLARLFPGTSEHTRLRLTVSAPEALLLLVFLYVSAVSLAVTVTLDDRPADTGIYRLSPLLDGVAEIGYAVLAIVAFLLVADAARRYPKLLVRAWLLGGSMAAWYGIYLLGASFLEFRPVLLPGGSSQIATVGDVSILRAGTFLEGNFFGLFLLMSLILALGCNRLRTGILCTGALLGSLSVLNILAMVVLWSVYLAGRTKRNPIFAAELVVLSVLLAVVLADRSPFVDSLVERVADPNSQSANERRGSVDTALRMYAAHPLLGVGPAQYGLWFRSYRPKVLGSSYISIRRNTRYIPNNVPAQLLAEQGTLGFLSLGTFFWSVERRGRRRRSRMHRTGLLLIFISLLAFPTVYSLVIWMFLGVLRGTEEAECVSQEI